MDFNDDVQILDYFPKNSRSSKDSCQDISNSGNDETKAMELDESNFFEDQEVLEELWDNKLDTFVMQERFNQIINLLLEEQIDNIIFGKISNMKILKLYEMCCER
jgi:hypothetical protein